MELEDLLTEAARLLGRFSAEVKAAGAASLNDIGVASDMFLVELLRETYGLQDLRNLNAEKANFPGLDLADDTAGVDQPHSRNPARDTVPQSSGPTGRTVRLSDTGDTAW